MGLKTEVDQILNQSLHTAYRPPALYTLAPHNIFVLSGGPAWVKGFIMYADATNTAGTDWQLSICGVIAENGGAAVMTLLVGEMAVWPLHGAAAADVAVPNVSNTPYPPLASELLGMSGGIMISPGAAAGNFFVMTVGTALPDGAHSFFVYYYKMRPETLISPA